MAYPLFHEGGPSELPMSLSTAEFSRLFAGEGDHVEFKQGLPEQKVREAVVAFSNSDGGVILLGVDPQGRAVGISTDGEMVARVHRVVNGVSDPGRYEVRPLPVGDRLILVVSVGRRREGFAQMPDGRVLVRQGAMNVPVFGSELARFVSSRALQRFEATPVSFAFADVDDESIERVRAVYGWSPDNVEQRMTEVGLLALESGRLMLTVAGALFLMPRPREALGKAFIEVFRYRSGAENYDRRLDIDGPADEQVAAATRELMSELGVDVVVLGTRRHELPRIPEEVLREAIANAVAHRSYEISGQPVRIEIHPDRVVIRSPGSLPEPVTLANMREQNSARNLVVIQTLRRFHLAEDAGRGIDVMEDAMDAALLERPVFDADADHVEVTLRLGSSVTPQERAWIAEVEMRGELRGGDRLLLLHASRGEPLTNSSARELLGVDSTHARTALHRLRDSGYLQQSGDRGGAQYSLARSLGPPAGLQLDKKGLQDIVLALAKDQRITNEVVRARTGLDRPRVLALLNSLVAAGLLARHGQRRGTYYTPTAEPDS